MRTLHLQSIRRGRFEATCGKCLGHSPPLSSDDPERALAELLEHGWSMYTPKYGVRTYPLCRACTANPPDVDKEVAAARKGRKRK